MTTLQESLPERLRLCDKLIAMHAKEAEYQRDQWTRFGGDWRKAYIRHNQDYCAMWVARRSMIETRDSQ
jgi:hypothetical protein